MHQIGPLCLQGLYIMYIYIYTWIYMYTFRYCPNGNLNDFIVRNGQPGLPEVGVKGLELAGFRFGVQDFGC